MIGDVVFYVFAEVLLNVVCYGAGAVAVVLASAGRIKPGHYEHEQNDTTIKREGEFTYTLDGARYVYQRWVIIFGVGVWLVVIIGATVALATRSI